jgi:hypothetical protein
MKIVKTPWTGDHPCSKAVTHTGQYKQNKKRRETSMPRVGFEPTIPVFWWANIYHALDFSATDKLFFYACDLGR